MILSGSSSGSSNSPNSSHCHRAQDSSSTEHFRQFPPWGNRSLSQDCQDRQKSQTPAPTGSATRAAAGLAELLGIAQQIVSRTTSQHSERQQHEYSMPTPQNHTTSEGHRHDNETSPLLQSNGGTQPPSRSPGTRHVNSDDKEGNTRARKIVWTSLTLLFVAALVFFLGFVQLLSDKLAPWIGLLPKDPHKAALVIMKQAPVIVSAILRLTPSLDSKCP